VPRLGPPTRRQARIALGVLTAAGAIAVGVLLAIRP
jgi:hypothetical protein